MRNPLLRITTALAVGRALFLIPAIPVSAQTPTPQRIPREADGKPNLTGLWQAFGSSDWDILDHASQAGPFYQLGALGAEPPGQSIVEGNEIPYLPKALEQKKANYENRYKEDPVIKCYMPGVPRVTYVPFPFQIIQGQKDIFFAYEFASTNRLINMGKPEEAATDTWMGTSNGHWDGDTLVIDVTGFNGMAWLDRAGDYASDSLHVVERYTMVDANTLKYEATITDPMTFSRPWKITLPLYRHREPGARLLEFKCVEYAEQMIYGPILSGEKKVK